MAASLTSITGIGPAAAGLLTKNGYSTAEALADASVAELSELPGFGPARSQQVINDAKALLAEQQADAAPDAEEIVAEAAEPLTENLDIDPVEEEQEFEAFDDADSQLPEESLYHMEAEEFDEVTEETEDKPSKNKKPKKNKKPGKAKKQKGKKEKGKIGKKDKTIKKSKKSDKKTKKKGKKSKKMK